MDKNQIDYAQDIPVSCCFTGHRVLPNDPKQLSLLHKNLRRAILLLASEGVDVFYTGGALGFDTMAALAVLEMKAHFPNIKLCLAVPFPGQSNDWSKEDKALYEQIKLHADRVDIVCPAFSKNCMKKRNYYMVDHSSVCVYYMVQPSRTGTSQTVNYARKNFCRMIDLLAPNEDIPGWEEDVHISEEGATPSEEQSRA